MFNSRATNSPHRRIPTGVCAAILLLSACNSGGTDDTASQDNPEETASETTRVTDTTNAPDPEAVSGADCADKAALFVTRGSANPDLDDPEVAATCEDGELIVTSNGIPDYTYIETSPGQPSDQDNTFTIPATPTVADTVTEVARLGTVAVTLGGIQIFGPTEGTGGDVESRPGILSDCGSHNGPTGFHIHLILTSAETDCLFTPQEVAAGPQLVGYAFDGFPIYTGADEYTSSWELTDEALFATDTWAAHTYIEGSGDLDQCNGLTDENGNYAYYTTATFPYVLGCYAGSVDLDGARGGGGDGGPGGDAEAQGARPARPQRGDDGAGPARPAPPEDSVDE